MTNRSPFMCFESSPEIIRLAVMLYVRFPLTLRNVENLLHKRGIDISHETVRFWWHRFGPMFANEIKKCRLERLRTSHWQWHLDEVFVMVDLMLDNPEEDWGRPFYPVVGPMPGVRRPQMRR